MRQAFPISFENGHHATVIEPGTLAALPVALQQIGLELPRRTLVLVGGAGKMAEADLRQLRPLFEEVLGPMIAAEQVAIVDGGTDVGVMRLAGDTRRKLQRAFDLIGIAAVGTVIVPGRASPSPDAAPLEPNHSHFILVPGSEWGVEAPWIARAASILAHNLPSATLLINGGEIAWQDVTESIKAARPVLVVAGSGRTADMLVDVLQGKRSDPRAKAVIATGLLHVLDPQGGTEALRQVVRRVLGL
jgi:hypothetical protein